MKFGIDFGTTRIIVAAVDRGNFPLVSFETADGTYDWFPSLVAARSQDGILQLKFGREAWQVQGDRAWTMVRSLKRHLEDAGPETKISIAGHEVPLSEVLTGLTSSLYRQLQTEFGETVPFEVMLGVPANANSNQRFLTVDAFRRAGFQVLGLLNEPSAAAIEFSHRQKAKGRILVYDLGGGTFDASLVEVEGGTHTVAGCTGISNLGGDDFDLILAELAVGKDALYAMELGEVFRLAEECRRQKEALHPNSRKIVVDLDQAREGMGQVTVSVADFYDRCRPLIDESLAATAKLAEGQDIESLYITGGGSELPLVARVLREEFGRKVKRSEYTRSATAIGLAIQADDTSGYRLREIFTRNFGVWRETDSGERMVFDTIFLRDTRIPAAGEAPLTARRSYAAVHNLGHFRYFEASEVGEDLQPAGDITLWDEILFPFDPALASVADLTAVSIERTFSGEPQEIEERYTCDATGGVSVNIRNVTSGYERDFRVGRWSGGTKVIKPAPKKRSKSAAR